jgi:hypothetical protein
MWPSAFSTLGVTHAARNAAITKELQNSALPELALESLRRRNAVLDALFYDIKVIPHAEAENVAPWLAAEGALLYVPPQGGGAMEVFPSADALANKHRDDVSTLAVAGVGSSALGSAAYARNVADAIGRPVVAVVSGYGMADLAAEALGGYFWFGGVNAIRHFVESVDLRRKSGMVVEPLAASNDLSLGQLSRDVQSVIALLQHKKLQIKLLTGHSKGNLVISEALYELSDRDSAATRRVSSAATIVTVSAKVGMPKACKKVIDVIGALDNFGFMNSRRDIRTDVSVPNAWHHTNTSIPLCLPVTETFRELLKRERITL